MQKGASRLPRATAGFHVDVITAPPALAESIRDGSCVPSRLLRDLAAPRYHVTFEALLRALDALFTPATEAG